MNAAAQQQGGKPSILAIAERVAAHRVLTNKALTDRIQKALPISGCLLSDTKFIASASASPIYDKITARSQPLAIHTSLISAHLATEQVVESIAQLSGFRFIQSEDWPKGFAGFTFKDSGTFSTFFFTPHLTTEYNFRIYLTVNEHGLRELPVHFTRICAQIGKNGLGDIQAKMQSVPRANLRLDNAVFYIQHRHLDTVLGIISEYVSKEGIGSANEGIALALKSNVPGVSVAYNLREADKNFPLLDSYLASYSGFVSTLLAGFALQGMANGVSEPWAHAAKETGRQIISGAKILENTADSALNLTNRSLALGSSIRE